MPNDTVGDVGVVGDVTPQSKIEAQSILDGLGEEHVVALHNPLSSDFRVQYARSVVASPRLTREEEFARDKGIPTTKEQNPMAHTIQFLTLKAGETKNLPGDIAQIAGRKLVTYILMAQAGKGNAKMVADKHSRREVEEQIVVKITSRMDFMNLPPEATAEELTNKQIEELNVDSFENEKEFEEVPDPPPGTGVTFERASPSRKASK